MSDITATVQPAPSLRTPLTTRTPVTFRAVRERWPLLVPFAVLLPLALGIAAMIDHSLLFWDTTITSAAVDSRGTWVDQLALTMSRLGAWPIVYPAAAGLALIAYRRCPRLALIIVLTVAARPAIEWLLKDIVERPRPAGDRLVPGTGFSFPSGHPLAAIATWAFLPAVVALYTHRRALWWAAVAASTTIVMAVAWSRVWLGVHWTSDVVASLALGYLAFNALEAWAHRVMPCPSAQSVSPSAAE